MICNSYFIFKHDIEKKDPRGRTPLMLAVTLNHLESSRVLLRHGADVIVENKQGYTGINMHLDNKFMNMVYSPVKC